MSWNFENTYLKLPEDFYKKVTPTHVQNPIILMCNNDLLKDLDLSDLTHDESKSFFSGNKIPPGADPIAQAYSGHQFGHPNRLGDGRAILLGEHLTKKNIRYDIQLKGSGQTPYSRRGDGKAAIGPMLREYLISEAMFALGIATTRSLAVVATGETVFREKPLKGAVLTRVAKSHIRVGTFEHAYQLNNPQLLETFCQYTICRLQPEIVSSKINLINFKYDPHFNRDTYIQFLKNVCDQQALLISQWMLVGFIHGVMNTDNMSVSGETLDYGPCAFMNTYDPDTVYSSIDHGGRYAFGKQHIIGSWNLSVLAQCLVPLLSDDTEKAIQIAHDCLNYYSSQFEKYWLSGMLKKIGLSQNLIVNKTSSNKSNHGQEDINTKLVFDLLDMMYKHKRDYTNTFLDLALDPLPQNDFYQHPDFINWHRQWREILQQSTSGGPLSFEQIRNQMNQTNPSVIPRNYLVEEALYEASEHEDLTKFHDLLRVLKNPFQLNAADRKYQIPPDNEDGYKTFCGT